METLFKYMMNLFNFSRFQKDLIVWKRREALAKIAVRVLSFRRT